MNTRSFIISQMFENMAFLILICRPNLSHLNTQQKSKINHCQQSVKNWFNIGEFYRDFAISLPKFRLTVARCYWLFPDRCFADHRSENRPKEYIAIKYREGLKDDISLLKYSVVLPLLISLSSVGFEIPRIWISALNISLNMSQICKIINIKFSI